MKTLGKLLTIGIASLMLSCIVERKPSVELCNCIHNPQFQESNQLSQECIDACIEFFGEDLEGMEDWFKKNCPSTEAKGQSEIVI
jgi:hypothetical protein